MNVPTCGSADPFTSSEKSAGRTLFSSPMRQRTLGPRPPSRTRAMGGHYLRALLHEARLVLVQRVELLRDVVADRLDPSDRVRIELRGDRAARAPTRKLEECVELVAVRLLRFGIGPLSFPGELPVLRPDAVGKRHRPDFVAGDRRVDRHDSAGDLLLDHGVSEFVQHRMPYGMVAQLKPLI